MYVNNNSQRIPNRYFAWLKISHKMESLSWALRAQDKTLVIMDVWAGLYLVRDPRLLIHLDPVGIFQPTLVSTTPATDFLSGGWSFDYINWLISDYYCNFYWFLRQLHSTTVLVHTSALTGLTLHSRSSLLHSLGLHCTLAMAWAGDLLSPRWSP